MKTIIKITIFLSALLAMYSCSKEVDTKDNANGIGYMSFSNTNITVEVDAKPTNSRVASNDAPDDFIITIKNAENVVVHTGTYGDTKAEISTIEFKAGTYTIEATSPTETPNVGWETPTYYGTTTAIILREQTTLIDDLKCKMSNIKATVELQPRLKTLFKADNGSEEDLKITLTLDTHAAIFNRDETRASFFKAQQENNTILLELSGVYNKAQIGETPDYVQVEWKQNINNAKAGQYRRIYIKANNINDGNVHFEVEIETWTYNENIDIDVSSPQPTWGWGEEEFADADNKTTDANCAILTLGGGHDFASQFIVNSDIFNPEGECTDKITLTTSTNNAATIERFDIVIETQNTLLTSALAAKGILYNNIRLLPTNNLSDYFTISGNSYELNNMAMKALFKYDGIHKATIITVDSENRRSHNVLTISVIKQATTPPTVEWLGGFDFNIRYDITGSTTAEEFPVKIKVSSSTGVTGFVVEINSAIIDDVLLGPLGLATSMDLISPASDTMNDMLNELGFSTRENVQGHTLLNFDITSFMPLIPMLGEGDVDFTFKVTDAAGTTEITLKLNSIQ